jgi:hypothetical protein
VKPRESFLVRDPDERALRWGWVFWFAWLGVGGALLLGDYRAGVLGIGAVLAAPFWALWLLWALYRAARFGMRRLRHSGWQQWDGRYFEFDGRQVRILFDGDDIWFGAGDVFDVLGTASSARDPDRVRQIVGRDGLQCPPESELLCFSEKGLAAWLDRRSERPAGQLRRWVEAQVVSPYRRRRELDAGSESAGRRDRP